MTLVIHWWMIPTVISIICFGNFLYPHDDGADYGISTMLRLFLGIIISLAAWFIGALCK